MIQAFVYLNNDGTYTPFFNEEAVPKPLKDKVEYVDIPDVVDGHLKRNTVSGEFYWEPIYPALPEVDEPPVESEQPKPELSLEEMQAQTLLNTEYLVSRSELGLGGN